MRFKVTEIAPDGRNKYGNYYSSGNMTRNITSVSYGGNATTTSIGTPETQIAPEVIQQYFVQAAEGSVDFTTPELADYVTKSIGFNAQVGNEKVPIYIMDLSQVTYNNGTFSIPTNNGVTGNPSMPLTPGSGLNISFTNNGTTGTTINLQGNPNLSNWTGGTLSIPVAMYIGKGTQPQGNDLYPTDTLKSWFDAYIVYDEEEETWVLTNNVVISWVTINWTYTEVIEVTSVYALSLSNDVAMIVANADGTIPAGAYLPSSEGKLYYGSTRITGATYSIETSCPVTGLTSSTTSGVLSLGFQHPVSFSADTMEIQVSASTAGEVVDVKTFSIAKAKPGADGQSPTIYWLMTSTDSVQYNPNTSAVTPNNVTVTAYTQTGTNPISPYLGANITVEMISRSSGTGPGEDSYYGDYPAGVPISPALAISTSKLRFRLYVNNNVVDMEDVEILMDGTNGSSGRTGAAVRGPYNYEDVSGSTRIWCNGEPSQAFPESEKWIDVIIKDDVYYYCTTTYQGTLNWSQYSGNWTSGDSFDFVATNLLMAENAKINFLSGNEIYLGSGNSITGGMAGGTGSTVAFWAGNSESDPTFSVDHDGNMVVKSGKFYGNVYTQFKPVSDLSTIVICGKTCYEAEYNGQIIANIKAYQPTETNYPIIRLPIPTEEYYGFTYTFSSGRGFGQASEVYGYAVVPYGYKMSSTLPSNQKYIYNFIFDDTYAYESYSGIKVLGDTSNPTVNGAILKICCMPYYYQNEVRPVWGLIEKIGTTDNFS